MKSRIAKGILVCALVLVARAASAEDAGCKAIDQAWKKAILAGDLDAIVANYADDAVLWLPGRARGAGHEGHPRDLRGLLVKDTRSTDVVLRNTVYETWQNLSTGWGNFTMTLQPQQRAATPS